MNAPLLPFKLPDLPAFYERAVKDFREVVMAEAAAWTDLHDDAVVGGWRGWAEALVAAIAWTSDERRQAFTDQLTAIAQEAQAIREKTIAQGGAA